MCCHYFLTTHIKTCTLNSMFEQFSNHDLKFTFKIQTSFFEFKFQIQNFEFQNLNLKFKFSFLDSKIQFNYLCKINSYLIHK